ncbi:MAG: CDP-diacylglycerol--glycerol-3-phosphate 3-phosphatidyltransferase [Erysipelotrichaceae bacterium]
MNLPNRISVFRIFLVPLLVLVMLFPYAQFGIDMPEYYVGSVSISLVNIIAVVIFVVASATDFLDGYLARRDNLVTSFGKFIDPIADKLLVNTILILLAVRGEVPILPILIMIWRDMLVDGMRMSAASSGTVVAAGLLGKAKTVVQMAAIVVLLCNNLPFELVRFPMGEFLLWLATFISVASGIVYFMKLKNVILESM